MSSSSESDSDKSESDSYDSESDSDSSEASEEIREEFALEKQHKRFEAFQSQDFEEGHFDITFEIEGKKIHANKIILITVSDILAEKVFSDWTTDDDDEEEEEDVVHIDSYTYNNFYQFLCYLYSGECELNQDSVYQLTDMAEVYDVPCLKESCDLFLSETESVITTETVEEMVEFAVKYSLKEFTESLREFIRENFDALISVNSFVNREKTFVEFASHPDAYESPEDFFKAAYKWAEKRTMKKQNDDIVVENVLYGEIVTELDGILPNIQFSSMTFEFLMNFVVENGFLLSSTLLLEYFLRIHEVYNDEALLQDLYHIAKKQALKQQKMCPSENFDLVASVRDDLSEIIPKIKFYEMEKSFLKAFVVAKGILTKEEASHVNDTRVTITNDANTITGSFKDDFGIYDTIQKIDFKQYDVKAESDKKIHFTLLKFDVSCVPITDLKKEDTGWYLCLEEDGILTFKHYSLVEENDYLLAEMKSNNEFTINPDKYSHIFASYYNV